RTVVEVEIAADFLDDAIEAAGANQFDPCVNVAVDPDLGIDELGRGANFERLDLAEIAGVKVEGARGIALPDADFPECEFVDVEKHAISPLFLRLSFNYRTGARVVKKARL